MSRLERLHEWQAKNGRQLRSKRGLRDNTNEEANKENLGTEPPRKRRSGERVGFMAPTESSASKQSDSRPTNDASENILAGDSHNKQEEDVTQASRIPKLRSTPRKADTDAVTTPARTGGKPEGVRLGSLSRRLFSDSFMQECDDAMRIRYTANKYDFKGRIEQYSESVKTYKKLIRDLLAKKEEYVAECTATESALVREISGKNDEIGHISEARASVQRELSDTRSQITIWQEKVSSLNKQIEDLNCRVAEMQKEGKQTSEDLTTTRTLLSMNEAELADKKRQLAEAESQCIAATEKAKFLEVQIQKDAEKHRLEVEALKSELQSKLQSAVQSHEVILGEMKTKLSEAAIEASDLRNEAAKIREKEMSLRSKVENIQRERDSLDMEAKRLEGEKVSITGELERLRLRLDTKDEDARRSARIFEQAQELHEKRLSELRSEKTNLEKSNEIAKTEGAKLQQEFQKLDKAHQESVRKYEELDREHANLKKAEAALRESVSQLNSEVSSLTSKLESATNDAASARQETAKTRDDLSQVSKELQATVSSKERLSIQMEQDRKAFTSELEATKQGWAQTREDYQAIMSQNGVLTAELKQIRESNDSLRTSIESLRAEVARGENEVRTLTDKTKTLETDLAAARAMSEDLKSEITLLREREVRTSEEHSKEIDGLKEAMVAAEKEKTEAVTAMESANDKADKLATEVKTFRELSGVSNQGQLDKLVDLMQEVEAMKKENASLLMFRQMYHDENTKAKKLEEELFTAETVRRQLHNTIQELRGNVRVFCRAKPLEDESTGVIQCHPEGTSCKLSGLDREYTFSYDKIFDSRTTQHQVFEEVSSLVQSALDGYKVCIFSYGQTGAGKTFTMQGDGAGDSRGIIPRAVEKVMETSERLRANHWEYAMEASFLEIYNEQVVDLLEPNKTVGTTKDKEASHNIAHDADGNTSISGMSKVPVSSPDQIHVLLQKAARNRSVGSTNMNERSSRSHSVFVLYITGKNDAQGVTLRGCLNLVDLAGSERVSRSGATGARFKETCAINKSLSSLADVFQALSLKKGHIPYRNSKLTYLLQPCLGGDGKTLMIVNVNPEPLSAQETLSSLRFASQVNQCEMSRPRRQITSIAPNGDEAAETSAGAGGASASGSASGSTSLKRPATAPASSHPSYAKPLKRQMKR
eukprot:Rmarinus@m.21236